MRNEIRIFLTAIMFYTRIPVSNKLKYSETHLNKATRYFPLIGVIVGSTSALSFYLSHTILPTNIAIIISMIATILLTGAFHEDGFADFCDGFGGGYSKEKILLIMKDSQNGSYGVAGMIIIVLLKYSLLTDININHLIIVMISAHTVSRILPVIVIKTTKYSRLDSTTGKIKPIGKKTNNTTFIIALLIGLTPIPFLPIYFSITLISLYLVGTIWFRNYIIHKIEGYTGDTLGTLQQLGEVLFYTVFVAFQYLSL